MKRNACLVWGAVLVGCVSVSVTLADELSEAQLRNWHQWRGPWASGESPEGDPPVSFGPTKNVRWKVAIPGHGTSTPIIWEDRIFILTAVKTDRTAEQPAASVSDSGTIRWVAARPSEDPWQRDTAEDAADEPRDVAGKQRGPGNAEGRERGPGGPPGERRPGRGRGFWRFGGIPAPTNYYRFLVLCLDKKTGNTLWERVACEAIPHEGIHPTGSYAPASPVTDGRFVYCSFGSRGIYCYDLDGNLQWKTDLGDMRTRNSFGEGCSPVLQGDTLIINWDQEEDSFITALDAKTGQEKWRKDRDEPTTWNTPLIVDHEGRKQVVVNGTNRVRSYDLLTGELLWECGGQTVNPIPSPMHFDGLAICVSGFRGYAAYAIPLDAKGDITDSAKIAWQLNRGTPYVSSAVLLGDRLFFTKDRSGILSCVDARTGELRIQQKRMPALSDVYASPVSAVDRVYFSGRDGSVVVIDGKANELKVLATNELGEAIDASPAIVGDEMFIRSEKHLYCFGD